VQTGKELRRGKSLKVVDDTGFQVVVHPNYAQTKNGYIHDIALVKLVEPVDFGSYFYLQFDLSRSHDEFSLQTSAKST
jgi:hypothetical protein